MESELQKFRRKKKLLETKEEIKTKLRTTADSWIQSVCQALLPKWQEDDEEEEEEELEEGGKTGESKTKDELNSENRDPSKKWLMYVVIFLRFLAWLFVYIGFLKIGFGAVFFTISSLVFIYWNMNSRRKRKKGEVSAYSVFNKDCQSIDGTLKAEHLEKQLLYRN